MRRPSYQIFKEYRDDDGMKGMYGKHLLKKQKRKHK